MRTLHLVPGAEAVLPPAITEALEFAESWVGSGGDIGATEVALLADEFGIPANSHRDFVAGLQARGHRIIADRAGQQGGEEAGRAIDGFQLFVRAAAHRLLTADEEQILGRRIAEGVRAAAEIERGPASEDTRRSLEAVVRRGQYAEDEFLLHNLRLVLNIAKGYQQRGLDLEDLFQEGVFGLQRAVRKFDYTKGFKFSTYATWWVRQTITRAISNQARTIRIPVHMTEVMKRVSRAERRFETELGRVPTEREVAAEAGVDVATVRNVRRIRRTPVSLDAHAGSKRESTGEDADIEPAREPEAEIDLDDVIDNVALCGIVSKAFSQLSERERVVLRRRFGFEDGKIHTLEAIGRDYGLTRERIRQIESKVLEQLRESSQMQEARELLVESA